MSKLLALSCSTSGKFELIYKVSVNYWGKVCTEYTKRFNLHIQSLICIFKINTFILLIKYIKFRNINKMKYSWNYWSKHVVTRTKHEKKRKHGAVLFLPNIFISMITPV